MRKRVTFLILVLLVLIGGAGVYFAGPKIFGSVVAPLPEQYQPIIQKYAKEYGIDACLIAAIVRGESNWNPNAGSFAGARGLMQIMHGTFRSITKRDGLPSGSITDPEANIRAGVALLRYNFNAYGTLRNVLIAYNAGGSRVYKVVNGKRVLRPDNEQPRETQGYLKKIPTYYDVYKSAYPAFCTAQSTSANPHPSVEPDLPDFEAPAQAEQPNLLKPEEFWKALF